MAYSEKTTRDIGRQSVALVGGSFPKPLSAEEERHYILTYEKGSPSDKKQAKDVLIVRNLRLVAHIVKKFHRADVEDLISIGTIGLIKGISSFDASKGVRLATYASRCIENAILVLVMHITPFLFLEKIYVCFCAFQEDVYNIAFDDYALYYPFE